MFDWLAARPRWLAWTLTVTALLIAFGMGASTSTEETPDDGPAVAEQVPVADEPEPEPEPEPTPESEHEPEPEPADTGRMTSDELRQATDALDRFEGEVSEFANEISSKCAALVGSAELEAGSDCVGDAWDGVEGRAVVASDTLQGLEDDVAKRCRRALRNQISALDDLYSNLSALREFAGDLQFDAVAASQGSLADSRGKYDRRLRSLLRHCEPS